MTIAGIISGYAGLTTQQIHERGGREEEAAFFLR